MVHKICFESIVLVIFLNYAVGKKMCAMNSKNRLYLSGRINAVGDLEVTIETLVSVFAYAYCDFQIKVYIMDRDEKYHSTIPMHCLENIKFYVISKETVSGMDFSCELPAIHAEEEKTFVAGLCAVLRFAIKAHLETYPEHYCKCLLGFRGGCLVACAESSAWTKFCEVQLPSSVKEASSNVNISNLVKIPENVLLLEEHLNGPVRTHNILKRKLDIAKKVKQDILDNSINGENEPSEINRTFTLYDVNSVAIPAADLPQKFEALTINEKSDEFFLNHLFLEGIDFTLADVIAFPSVHYLLKKLHPKCMFHLPNIVKWYQRMSSKDVVKKAAEMSGLYLQKLDNLDAYENISILVPKVDKTSLYKSDPSNTKMKCKHHNPARIIKLLKDVMVFPKYVFNYCSELDWENMPKMLHPANGDLPQKRINRKCQQIESIVTAVLKVAQEGQKIVEFCAGGGHVGLLLAYFLPTCEVILIENKESSMMRAKNRAQKLNLKNVLFYQCNMDYFKGDFDVGLSLHACGVATDLVIQQCLKRQASFICCPCCYGGVQDTHLLSYPLSKKFRSTEIPPRDYMRLAHCADRNEMNTPTAEQGELCMGLIDMDRAYYAEEHGYKVELTKLHPASCSPKHNLLIGLSPLWKSNIT